MGQALFKGWMSVEANLRAFLFLTLQAGWNGLTAGV